MIRKQKRDWFRILRDLMEAGISMSQVARSCGRDPKAVLGWSDGSEPRDSDARIVLSLYARFCPAKFMEHDRQFRITAPDEPEQLPYVQRAPRPRPVVPGQPDLFTEGGKA